MSAEVTTSDHVPNEVLSIIMQNSLDGTTLLRSRLVCTRWKSVADDVIKLIWGKLRKDLSAATLGFDVKMRSLEGLVVQDLPQDHQQLGFLILFRRLHDLVTSECQIPQLPRSAVIQQGFMLQLHQYHKDQALMALWEQIRGIIDPKPHQVQILPPFSTPGEVREWICDVRNAPLLTMVERISLNGSGLMVLPDEIGRCIHLKALFVSANRLCSLPPSIIHLTQLEVLDLRFNRFTVFPEILHSMPANLRYGLDGNPVLATGQ
ncbi:MAG: F-box-like domain-containing protein [Verrucomicrobia bacterium]|nr:F-box-like domain-containing protein [Verrucomicrobiota bacterium]